MNPEIVRQIEAAVWDRGAQAKHGELHFLCPAHDDHRPSARWHCEKHVWHCDACGTGGGALDLARRLGIELPVRDVEGLTIHGIADRKGLPVEVLRSFALTEGVAGVERTRCVDIPYLDMQGEVVSIRKRLHLDVEPRFMWRRGDKVIPYGLWRLAEARTNRHLIMVEGESDTWTLWHAGLPALGVPGASTWKEAWKPHLQDIESLFLWREPDGGGDTLVSTIASDLPDIRIIEPPADVKDPNELWNALGRDVEAFRARMAELMALARPASELRAEALGQEARQLYAQAR